MPIQNRVTPFGEIVAVPDRGMLMGNRGCLHDDHRRVVRQVCSYKAWVACLTEFRERKRDLMTPGHYTELFFLDEATALAAGHRPCGECRHADYRQFKAAWLAGNESAGFGENPSVKLIDLHLHSDRLTDTGKKRVYRAFCGDLPDGVFVRLLDADDAYLVWRGQLHRWTPAGYDLVRPAQTDEIVSVLTPRSVARSLTAGYEPVVHSSAM